MKQADFLQLYKKIRKGRFKCGRFLVQPSGDETRRQGRFAVTHFRHLLQDHVKHLSSLRKHVVCHCIWRLRGKSKDPLFELEEIAKIETVRALRLYIQHVYIVISA